MRRIIFVCNHGVRRSQIARDNFLSYLSREGKSVETTFAGVGEFRDRSLRFNSSDTLVAVTKEAFSELRERGALDGTELSQAQYGNPERFDKIYASIYRRATK